jgi:hypothetical protein
MKKAHRSEPFPQALTGLVMPDQDLPNHAEVKIVSSRDLSKL